MSRRLYQIFGYFGLASIFGVLIHGFRYNPEAPAWNYVLNILLFAAWAGVHLTMTRSWFKQAVYGTPAGSAFERQVFITTTVTTWLALLWYHYPVPGFALDLPGWLHFAGHVGLVLCVFAFFEGITFPAIDGLLGVSGSAMTHSHGDETPLLTEGQYAQVRHPMYRAAILGGICSFVVHPHAAQLLWGLLIGGTFVLFIPVEERQLLAARGDAYRQYMQQTPWKVIYGVW
jgi:protein-S-isoprenylcysteine O-methyltransferase Ste14